MLCMAPGNNINNKTVTLVDSFIHRQIIYKHSTMCTEINDRQSLCYGFIARLYS